MKIIFKGNHLFSNIVDEKGKRKRKKRTLKIDLYISIFPIFFSPQPDHIVLRSAGADELITTTGSAVFRADANPVRRTNGRILRESNLS